MAGGSSVNALVQFLTSLTIDTSKEFYHGRIRYSERKVKDGENVKVTVFHGSHADFDQFRFCANGKSPGIWFGIDKNYVSNTGNIIYTCEIDCKKVIAETEDLNVAQMKARGFDAQLMVMHPDPDKGVPRDAYIIVADLDCIKIVAKERIGLNLEQDDYGYVPLAF